MGLAVYDEYLASLVAVPAAAFAIDAWYIEVMDRIPSSLRNHRRAIGSGGYGARSARGSRPAGLATLGHKRSSGFTS
jgi:hypothetical protein